MKVVIADRAKPGVRHRRAWWRKKRDLKHVFDEELREARRILKDGPKLAVHGMRQGLEVHRLNLKRIHCSLYYTINEAEGVVEIVALWGLEMAHQPDFDNLP